MAEQSDEVGVSISGALDLATNSGSLSAQTKSRFVGAVDRLLGALADLPATWLDALGENIRSSSQIKRDYREHRGKLARDALSRGDDAEARIIQLKTASELRELARTLNIAAVVGETAHLLTDESEILDEPSPSQPQAQHIDEDWLNRFEHFAGSASSDELRQLWARVLRGEVKKPGSYSGSALRFVADMDSAMAARCEAISRRVIRDRIYPTSSERSGQLLTDALALQAAGLLSGVGGLLSSRPSVTEIGHIDWKEGGYLLRYTAPPGTSIKIDIYIVTDLGQEIFSLLSPPKPDENLRLLFETIPKKDMDSAILYSVREEDGRILAISSEELYMRS